MKDNISPEERLLRLIKGEKKPSQSPSLSNPDTLLAKKIPRLSYAFLQKSIAMLIIVSFIYLTGSFIYPLMNLNKIKLPVLVKEDKSLEPKIEPRAEIKPYEFYLEGVRNHKIFDVATTSQISTPVSAANLDLIKDLSLVGIVSGDNPQAIIEDKKSQKTYYLMKGQFIGELQLEEIQEGKVILSYNGQRFELYL